MRSGLSRLILTSLIIFVAIGSSGAQTWRFLGERVVNKRSEYDQISITADKGTFTKIKLKVRNAGVEIFDVKVHFGNGEIYDVSLRHFIRAGGHTRVIDLPGGPRIIRKVVFFYKTRPLVRRRAIVELWGRR